MNKKGLINAAVNVLRDAGIRKPVSVSKERFTITDDYGDKAVFTIDRKDRMLHYNATDVCNIMDALIAVVEDCMRRGEGVGVRGFGQLEVRKTKEHRVREPDQEIWHTIPERYRPKFTAGANLSSAAMSYGLQEKDVGAEQFLPPPDDDEDMEA